MSRTLSVGLIQMKMEPEVRRNVTKAVELIGDAAAQGAEFVCLPELFPFRYVAQDPVPDERTLEEFSALYGHFVSALSDAARKHGVVVIGGSLIERSERGYWNSAPVIGPSGEVIGTYRKTHIPDDECYYESRYFVPGDGPIRPFEEAGVKFGVLICFDQWFPEPVRALVLQGAEIVFYPTAIGWVDGIEQSEGDWREAWETVQRGHSIANGISVVAVNRTGREGRIAFWGSSFVTDAFGNVLCRMGVDEEGVAVRRVDLRRSQQVREGWGFIRCRRPELYRSVIG
ncbi:MAG: nitrilase-related carbon-nitrogen hydrolase [Nitrososphaerota archaeon]